MISDVLAILTHVGTYGRARARKRKTIFQYNVRARELNQGVSPFWMNYHNIENIFLAKEPVLFYSVIMNQNSRYLKKTLKLYSSYKEIKKNPKTQIYNGNEVVYILDAGTYIKIGVSCNPFGRVKGFSVGSGHEIKRIATTPFLKNARIIERGFKFKYKPKRINGEWFRVSFDEACKFVKEKSWIRIKEEAVEVLPKKEPLPIIPENLDPKYYETPTISSIEISKKLEVPHFDVLGNILNIIYSSPKFKSAFRFVDSRPGQDDEIIVNEIVLNEVKNSFTSQNF